jgi:hypothetical protein
MRCIFVTVVAVLPSITPAQEAPDAGRARTTINGTVRPRASPLSTRPEAAREALGKWGRTCDHTGSALTPRGLISGGDGANIESIHGTEADGRGTPHRQLSFGMLAIAACCFIPQLQLKVSVSVEHRLSARVVETDLSRRLTEPRSFVTLVRSAKN